MGERVPVIIDTSTLINFLAVDRVDLLARSRQYTFLVTEHAAAEVSEAYPEQLARFHRHIAQADIQESPVTALDELQIFAQLAATNRLGPGECASIAAAFARGFALAIDDKRALKEALARRPSLRILNTQTLMVEFIHDGLLDVTEADRIKRAWEDNHRFRLGFQSFMDLL